MALHTQPSPKLSRYRRRPRGRRGYTLAEILISLGITGFVIMGGLWLMVEGVRTSARTTNSTVNDLTQWGIASRLWIDSRIANGITIYENNTDQKVERWLRKMVDQRGDFIVFSLSDTNGSAQTFYTKVSGYFYDRAARRIYRFDYDVTNADRIANASLESILTSRRDDILATYELVASNIGLSHNDGLFICRAAGTAASLTCTVSSGDNNAELDRQKTIEATFYVRS